MVSTLVGHSSDIDLLNSSGLSALHHAATGPDPRVFILLLGLGCNPYLEDVLAESAVLKGLNNSYLQPLICNSGLDLSILPSRAGDWSNPLWVDAKTKASTVRLLVRCLRNPVLSTMLSFESKSEFGEELPLCSAARFGKTAIIAVLLRAGADIELASALLGTPLIAAASAGQLEAVRMLFRRGALVKPKIPGRFPTAIHAAFSTGRKDIVEWFIKGRFTDQKKIHSFAHYSDQETKYWSGICFLGVPIDAAWKKGSKESTWEYLLFIREETQTWERLVAPAELARVSLVWELRETVISPCVEHC